MLDVFPARESLQVSWSLSQLPGDHQGVVSTLIRTLLGGALFPQEVASHSSGELAAPTEASHQLGAKDCAGSLHQSGWITNTLGWAGSCHTFQEATALLDPAAYGCESVMWEGEDMHTCYGIDARRCSKSSVPQKCGSHPTCIMESVDSGAVLPCYADGY